MQIENNIMNTGEIILYQTSDGQTAIDVRLENETIWLTQKTDSRIIWYRSASYI